MQELYSKAHLFILESKVGDYYLSGGNKVCVIKRTPRRVYFDNGDVITIQKSKHGFFFLNGKNVDQILRDIEGYLAYLIQVETYDL